MKLKNYEESYFKRTYKVSIIFYLKMPPYIRFTITCRHHNMQKHKHYFSVANVL